MTETVLSDAEVEAVVAESCPMRVWGDAFRFARAVERAVLASLYNGKAPADIAFKVVNSMGGYQVMASCVPEAECREREREAWRNGFQAGNDERPTHPESGYATLILNARYPSLLPKTPPPLTISTGRYRKPRGERWQKDLTPVEYITVDAPDCKTAADADALAAWLRQYGEGR